MAIIKFGHTWWGEKWLQALDHIDFSNRLPRGQRYARNGSVSSIDIDGSRIKAKVQGTMSQPYKVNFKLWEFTAKEKKAVTKLISASPYYLSQMEARILPIELLGDLESLNIRLFPRSWKDLNMKCSCPDWAVPCKHLASVVYIIANEIDKNPFLVFLLHDFDLLEAIHSEGSFEDEGIPGIDSFLTVDEKEHSYYRENLEHIDYSVIPDLFDSIQGLLTEFPLFYLKNDFKGILINAQNKMGKAVKKHIKNLDLTEDLPSRLYTSGEFHLLKGKNRYSGFLKKGDEKLTFSKDEPDELIQYIQNLSAGDLSVYPDILSYLIMVHNFVLKLLEKHSLIPEIYSLGKNSCLIRWIPPLFNGEIKDIFDNLVTALPGKLVKYNKRALEDKEQLLFIISFMVQYYFDTFPPVKEAHKEPVFSLFFQGKEYNPVRFEERENARTIQLWLGRFFTRPIHKAPVLKVDESGADEGRDIFLFDITVRDRISEEFIPQPLNLYLETEDREKRPLLRDLNLLSTYLPTVNAYLKEKGPVRVPASSFVETWFKALPALKTLGVSTILPKSLKESFVPRLTLSFKKKKKTEDGRVKSYTSLQDMMDFQWTLALGDEFITPDEFNKLIKKYRGIVRYKDKYLELNEEDLAKIQREMEKDINLNSLDLLRINLEGKYRDISIETDSALQSIFDELFKPEETSVPEGLNADLRPYQNTGFQWLYHNYKIGLGSLIADDMGLGKTIQVITLLLKLKEEGTLTCKKPAVAVVPASLVTNWSREIERFAPDLKSSIYHGSNRSLDGESDVIITTYAVVNQDLELLKKKKWLAVIIDEAQNIKTPDASRTKAVKSLKGDIKIAMTGTPVENKLMDYWSVLDYIMKNLLGNKIHFKEKYAVPIERFRDHDALSSFRNLTSPFILRRMKTDKSIISDLPDKIKQNIYTELTVQQTALYEGLINRVDELLAELEGIERSGIIFKLISGLKQICNHPALYLKEGSHEAEISGKTVQLLEILRKVFFSNDKVLIFTQFAQMGHILQELINKEFDTDAPFLYGKLNRKQRDEMVDKFQNDPDCKVMILSLKAGGVGLNLTAANHVVHYDLWWNPAVENQATDRAFRIGQKKDVNIHRFITKGTFEEKINAMLEEKQDLADLTVAQGEKWISNMNNKDLKELLKLER